MCTAALAAAWVEDMGRIAPGGALGAGDLSAATMGVFSDLCVFLFQV